MKQLTSILLVTALFIVTTPLTLLASEYGIEMMVQSGKKSKETNAVLLFDETGMTVTPKKKKFKKDAKTFAFTDIKTADYSHSKKPMLSGTGAIATALLVGFIFAIPFLFIKKKSHWLSIQTEDQFVVLKLRKKNFRAIRAELETKGVTVDEVEEEKKKDK